MKYLLGIYVDESADMSGADREAMYAEFSDLTEHLARTGMLIDGAQLQPTAAATTVRVRNGSPLATDGPFAETKEQLAGYYVVECESIDEAIEAAGRVPTARSGSVEVRPLVER